MAKCSFCLIIRPVYTFIRSPTSLEFKLPENYQSVKSVDFNQVFCHSNKNLIFAPPLLLNNQMAEVKNNDSLLDVDEAFSKTELYFEENKKSILIIIGAILTLIGVYLAYKYWYIPGEDEAAKKELFVAERLFEQDSLNPAITKFTKVADEFGMTPSGNLAEYYLGISYLRKGDFEKAIEHLEEFEAEDKMIGPMAIGALGDAHMELGKTEEAISFYLKAADKANNEFVTPMYLKKAGQAYESLKKYDEALKTFERIKNEYRNSEEGRTIDKYIAREKALGNLN